MILNFTVLWLVNDHSSNGFAVLLLLGCIDAVRDWIDGQAVHQLLHREVLDLVEMIRVVFLDNGDPATCTSDICPCEPTVKLDDIGTCRKRQMGDCLVSIQ